VSCDASRERDGLDGWLFVQADGTLVDLGAGLGFTPRAASIKPIASDLSSSSDVGRRIPEFRTDVTLGKTIDR
jgi:hypothetical protein